MYSTVPFHVFSIHVVRLFPVSLHLLSSRSQLIARGPRIAVLPVLPSAHTHNPSFWQAPSAGERRKMDIAREQSGGCGQAWRREASEWMDGGGDGNCIELENRRLFIN